MRIKSYKDLTAWQKAMDLVTETYQVTARFPKQEIYGLAQQMRRAAVSIPSNIAEGHDRLGSREYVHHLSIAQGSLAELETQFEIAKRLGYVKGSEDATCIQLMAETGRIMNGLLHSLERLAPGPRPQAPAKR